MPSSDSASPEDREVEWAAIIQYPHSVFARLPERGMRVHLIMPKFRSMLTVGMC